jgi:hypothetical protein
MANRTRVESDGLGDWRLGAVTRLASDLPAAYPGGPSHKAGATVALVMRASGREHKNFFFPTPNSAALAFDEAFRAAERAAESWEQIEMRQVVTPEGPGVAVMNAPVLWNFFTGCVASVAFSFQAIETFSNQTIVDNLKDTMTLQRRRGSEVLNAKGIERRVSTEEKLATVLPRVLNITSIKGTVVWERFQLLKKTRDAAIHWKSEDQYPPAQGGKLSDDSLWGMLLNNDPRQWPLIALRVIWSVRKPTGEIPRWLDHLAEKHGVS